LKIKCRRIFLAILLNEFIYSDIGVSSLVLKYIAGIMWWW